jgi:heme/copper-type cytochrome/quinol oxidase subunit 3
LLKKKFNLKNLFINFKKFINFNLKFNNKNYKFFIIKNSFFKQIKKIKQIKKKQHIFFTLFQKKIKNKKKYNIDSPKVQKLIFILIYYAVKVFKKLHLKVTIENFYKLKLLKILKKKKLIYKYPKKLYAKDLLNYYIFLQLIDKNYSKYINSNPYHILKNDRISIITALSIALFFLIFYYYLHLHKNYIYFIIWGFLHLMYVITMWLKKITIEGFKGYHTLIVQRGFRLGFKLFICSEIMFFFSFFWAFFSSSLSPTIFINCVYPPVGIDVINPFKIPLLNTCYLITSGFSLTYAYRFFKTRYFINKYQHRIFMKYLKITIILGILFLMLQMYEFKNANFAINDSVYGSNFYMITGFHGFHVFLGLYLILLCFLRMFSKHSPYKRIRDKRKKYEYTPANCVGLQLTLWYWHFVDVIWIFVFIFVYYWGSL